MPPKPRPSTTTNSAPTRIRIKPLSARNAGSPSAAARDHIVDTESLANVQGEPKDKTRTKVKTIKAVNGNGLESENGVNGANGNKRSVRASAKFKSKQALEQDEEPTTRTPSRPARSKRRRSLSPSPSESQSDSGSDSAEGGRPRNKRIRVASVRRSLQNKTAQKKYRDKKKNLAYRTHDFALDMCRLCATLTGDKGKVFKEIFKDYMADLRDMDENYMERFISQSGVKK